ncbi:MAG: hypothetical protein Q9O62_02925 [Ardenticatenia bacterium]|nr:hypothetical protein [Ardenticatenia bacterium]
MTPAPTVPRVTLVLDEALWRLPRGWRHGPRPAQVLRFARLVEMDGQPGTWSHVTRVGIGAQSEEELLRFHTSDYVATVRALETGHVSLLDSATWGLRHDQVPPFPEIHRYFWHHVAAVLTVAEVIVDGTSPCAFTPAGGYHLVRPAEARGFGVYNDVVLAIMRLREAGWRVAYVNLDARHADAVQAAFAEEPNVLTISIHQGPEFGFPGTGSSSEIGAGTSVNLPLPPNASDDHALWAVEHGAVPVLERFGPEVLLIQVGGSLHANDPLTHTRLTTRGLLAIVERLAPLAPRKVTIGGHSMDVASPPRLWALTLAHLAGHHVDEESPLPYEYRERWGGHDFPRSPRPVPIPGDGRLRLGVPPACCGPTSAAPLPPTWVTGVRRASRVPTTDTGRSVANCPGRAAAQRPLLPSGGAITAPEHLLPGSEDQHLRACCRQPAGQQARSQRAPGTPTSSLLLTFRRTRTGRSRVSPPPSAKSGGGETTPATAIVTAHPSRYPTPVCLVTVEWAAYAHFCRRPNSQS